jgi:hypothetical protein
MPHRWPTILALALLVGLVRSVPGVAQTERGPYARIAIMRAMNGHGSTSSRRPSVDRGFDVPRSTFRSVGGDG